MGGKQVKLSLFCRRHDSELSKPREPKIKLTQTLRKLNNLSGYKISTQK